MEEIHRIWTPGFRPVSGSASLRGPRGLSHPERSINNGSQMNIKHLKKIFFLNWIPVLSSGNNLKLSFSLKWGLKRFVIHWNLLFIGERSNGKQRGVVSLNRMKLWDETTPSYTFTLTLFGYFNHNFRSYLHWKYKFSFGKTFKNTSLSSLSTSEAKVVDIFLTRYFNNHATDTNDSYGLDWWIFFMSLGTKLQYKKFKFE